MFSQTKKAICISEIELFEINKHNMLDDNFIYLINIFKNSSSDELYNIIKTTFENNSPSLQKWYSWYYNRYKSYWGNLEPLNNDYEVMNLRAISFHEHWEDFLWLYNKLKDYRSKQVLYNVLLNWMFFMEMSHYTDKFMECYFDLDIIKCDKDEVFVDLGTFTGDTVQSFIDHYGDCYQHIYCYDISSDNLEQAKINLSKYKNIEYRLKAISDRKELVYFDSSIDPSAYHLADNGYEIEAIALDQDISEKITFIKADIEGAEQKAILGARKHIINDKPKLAFSIYHNNEDIWKIARMIDDICPGYDFYIRYHGTLSAASEFTLLAVYNTPIDLNYNI